MDKQFSSIFVPEEKINLPNYITELIIKNWLSFYKKPTPTSPFWRKDICANNTTLEWLSNKYSMEISAVNDYLKVFSPEVLIKILKKRNLITLKFLKLEWKKDLLNELFNEQLRSSNKCMKQLEEEAAPDMSLPFTGTTSFKTGNSRSGLL